MILLHMGERLWFISYVVWAEAFLWPGMWLYTMTALSLLVKFPNASIFMDF